MFCNVVYAWLAGMAREGDLAAAQAGADPPPRLREQLDEQVSAPAGGWDAAEANLRAVVAARAREE